MTHRLAAAGTSLHAHAACPGRKKRCPPAYLRCLVWLLTAAGLCLAQASKPNIVIIMSDDMGFSDIGCYGGEIETPHLDRLAENGLRFTQFYNNGRCCPTRASLLTGLYSHQTGIGHMTNENTRMPFDKGHDSYRGQLNRQCVTIGEALRPAGYRTLMSGKWHVGTFEGMWPVDRGFDRYYGTIRGASNFFRPAPDKLLTLDGTPVVPGEGFYTTDAFTDYAIRFVDEADRDDDEQPFFLYLAYTAAHWPLHAWPEDVKKYRGRYRKGWEQLRQERLGRMRSMGLIRKAWDLSALDALRWDALPEPTQQEMEHRMAIYAAQVDRMDQGVGRFLRRLEELDELDDTLILFLIDNGGCAEGGQLGAGPAWQLTSKQGYLLSYGRGWANASNTPFREFKHWVHEGGIATPLIAHWPQGIAAKGEFRAQPAHLIDLMATALDVAGAEYPSEFAGESIVPLEGESLVPAFRDEPLDREAIYWEHEGNRAVRMGDWKLVSKHPGDWELYDMAADRTETNDLAAAHPQIRLRMAAMWERWAEKVGVQPWPVKTKPGFTPPNLPYPETADY